LPGDTDGMLAFFQKPSLVNDQYPIGIAKRFKHIATHQITQSVCVPLAAPQKRLHPIRPRKPSMPGHQPAGLPVDPGQ
jgi:hypothetical protein